jgi:predicted small lipoprotein YifL
MNNNHPARMLLLTLLLMLACACGQKGSLYLPDNPDQPENRISATGN